MALKLLFDPVNGEILGAQAVGGEVVDPSELPRLMAEGWKVIDVRTPAEHARGAIPGSVNVPLDTLRDHLGELGDSPIVVYCEVGQRGHTSTSLLHELDITARSLDGGYLTWSAADAASHPACRQRRRCAPG